MSKRKPLNKEQARERRDRLLQSAAAAELALADGVRQMRAIAGMTQEEFARHRGVSARVIKAIELDQGNPTVATMNRIGQFFGLEVGFVPIRRVELSANPAEPDEIIRKVLAAREAFAERMRHLNEMTAELDESIRTVLQQQKELALAADAPRKPTLAKHPVPETSGLEVTRPKKRKPGSA